MLVKTIEPLHIHILLTNMFFLLILIITTFFPQPSHSQAPPPQQLDYSICKEKFYNCGNNITDISYPFWGQDRPFYCGGGDLFKLTCSNNNDKTTAISIGTQNFKVMDISITDSTIKMQRTDRVDDVCSSDFKEINLIPNLFRFHSTVRNMTIFFDCPFGYPELPSVCLNAICYAGSQSQLLKENGELKNCSRYIQEPTDRRLMVGDYDIVSVDELGRGLREGFRVNYTVNENCVKCLGRDGNCGGTGSDDHEDIDQLVKSSCYYSPDGSIASSNKHCSVKEIAWNWKRKLAIGLASAVLGTLAMFTLLYLCKPRKNRYATSHIQSRSLYSDPSSKDPEKGSQPFATCQNFGVQHFTYAELEKATDFFDSSKKLGEGGFGTVYFGKLNDGRCVAVKMLFENNYRKVEQFKNEVEILARLFHPNLVSLYGCTSRHSHRLLLVYEYISNGTVADHLHGKQAQPGRLPWHIRMNIAVETASALQYLHLSDIIHRDIKTNNILLDSHFHVKVADFGLSRLFPFDCTHVSTAPQGTPGYLDPEYHENFQLTHKSDVYSFGVVLFQLISSLSAVDITRHTNEINLADMAINKIQNQALHELVDPSLGFESDLKVGNMITAVAELAFQCVQCPKQLRPSMKQVLETLEGIREGTWKFDQIT